MSLRGLSQSSLRFISAVRHFLIVSPPCRSHEHNTMYSQFDSLVAALKSFFFFVILFARCGVVAWVALSAC